MKRMDIFNATYVYDLEEEQGLTEEKETTLDRFIKLFYAYLPEILTTSLIIMMLISITHKTSYEAYVIGALLILLIIGLYIMVIPIYVNAIKAFVLIDNLKKFKYTYFKDDLNEILCMDDDKFNPKSSDDGTLYRVERIQINNF